MAQKSASFFEAFRDSKPGRPSVGAAKSWWQKLARRKGGAASGADRHRGSATTTAVKGVPAAKAPALTARPAPATVASRTFPLARTGNGWEGSNIAVPRVVLIGAAAGMILLLPIAYIIGYGSGRWVDRARTTVVEEAPRPSGTEVARSDGGARPDVAPPMMITGGGGVKPTGVAPATGSPSSGTAPKAAAAKTSEAPPASSRGFYSLRVIGGIPKAKAQDVVDALQKQGHGDAFSQAPAREGGTYAVYVGRFDRQDDKKLLALKAHFSREQRFAGCYVAPFAPKKD